MPSHVLTGTLYPAPAERPYVYLPFELPEGTTRLSVRYRYDEGNIIDLGLLDPHIEQEDFPAARGFRGWSGGARDSFFVTEREATPGYLAGELFPGRWFIMFGLYKVQPQGCDYRVEITFEDEARAETAPRATPKGTHKPAGWYRGDLHAHTHHSDAKGSLCDLVRAAEARGLEFLAVTDHNTVSHHRALLDVDTSLLLIPGQEVTTRRGHANIWGETGWIDFRIRGDDDIHAMIDWVHARGGVFSLNHPKNTGHNWEYSVPQGFDGLEVWQSAWAYRNWESVALADALLRQGRRFAFVGGSDRHQPGWPDTDPPFLQVGTPTTWLYLEAWTAEAAVAALRSGRTCISEGPAGPCIELSVADTLMGGSVSSADVMQPVMATVTNAAGGTLRYQAQGGVVRRVVVPSDTFSDSWLWQPEGRFLRAEVVASSEANALETQRELAAAGIALSGAQLSELLVRPRLRALSGPVFVGASFT